MFGRGRDAFEHEIRSVFGTRRWKFGPCERESYLLPRFGRWRHARATRTEAEPAVTAIGSAVLLLAHMAIVGVELWASRIDEIRCAPVGDRARVEVIRWTVFWPLALAARVRNASNAVRAKIAFLKATARSDEGSGDREAYYDGGE